MIVEQFEFTMRGAFLAIGGLGLFTHFVFNRWEPLAAPILTILLAIIPLGLSVFLLPHFSFILSLCLAFVTYHAVLLTSIVMYRLSSLHPLARYPGPTLLKISQFVVLKMVLTGKRHEYIQSLHELYGSDFVRTGPNELSIRDVSAIGPVMGTNGLAKGPGYDGRAAYKAHRSLLNWRDPAIRANRRKPWSRGTSTSALKEYEPVLAKRITQLVELILRHGDGRVDLSECISYFAYDFMGDMAFGGGTELMRDGDTHGLFKTMEMNIKAGCVIDALPWFSYHMLNIPSIARRYREVREGGLERAKQRVLKGTVVRDLFHYLNNDDGTESTSPSIEAVAAEGSLVILAGSDTTSSVLVNAMYLLMRHPEVYQKLQREVDQFYPPGENALDCKHHPQMLFLEAVINETLRFVSRSAQRESACYPLARIDDRITLRSTVYESNTFFPERWIIAEDPSTKTLPSPFIHNPDAFIPFSFGPANCVGKNLALKEMKMVICYLMQQLEVRFADGYDPAEWEREMEDLFAMQVGRLPLVVKPRGTVV